MTWTDEQRAAIFKAFYTDGESASTIAARYGVARNAIIGVAHRMRARAGAPKKRPPAARTAEKQRAQRMATIFKPRMVGMSTRLSPATADAFAAVAAAPVFGFALKSLGEHQCRFAVTPHDAPRAGHLFCGAPADGPYCPRHTLIATQRQPA